MTSPASFLNVSRTFGAIMFPAVLLFPACSGKAPEPPPFALLYPTAEAPVISTGTFKSGDLLEYAFPQGIPFVEIAGVEKALKKAGSRYIMPGDVYSVAASTCSRLGAFALARGENVYTVKRDGDSFSAVKSTMPVVVEDLEASGELSSSLWYAMKEAGLSAAVIMEFADIFAWTIDFLTEPRKGDRFALVWEKRTTALGEPCGIRIKAAAYKGSETGSERGYYHKGSFYDAEGKSLRRAFLRAPLTYRRISSYFSRARFHPILRIYRPHNGIDYAAPSGTPVSAIADGKVTFRGWKGGYGKYIGIRHAGSYTSGYGHLRSYAKGVRAGARVKQGQVIGYVGKTGLATGPHLDFSFRVNGRFVNFLKFRPPVVTVLKGAELEAFKHGLGPEEERLERLITPADKKGATGVNEGD